MLIGPLARDDVNQLRLVYTARYAERKPGLDKSQRCWRCIILDYPLISMYNQRYKKLFQTIKDGPASQTSFSNCFLGNLASLGLTTSLALSPSPSLSFLGWIPIWSMEAHYVYLLALASKTEARGSPERDTLCYSRRHLWPDLDVAKLLSHDLISFPHQLSYSASSLH